MEKGCLVLILAVFTFGRLMAGDPATAVATITAGFVTGITVTSGGSGYTSEPSVTLSGGGGIGASGKAIMAGDKVALISVLTAGTGYSTAPTVVVDAPPKPLSVSLRLIPELTIEGPPGILVRVESAGSPMGPWTAWTNVTVSKEGVLLRDLTPGAATRFYRTLDPRPTGPSGTSGTSGFQGAQGTAGTSGISAGGGASMVYRTLKTGGAFIVITGVGSQTDIDNTSITFTGGNTLTISSVGSLRLNACSFNYDAGVNATASINVVYPELNGQTTITYTQMPVLAYYNNAGPSVIQANTQWNVSNSSGTVTVQRTGLTGSPGAAWKIIF
jgi:hypothetical protein